MQSIRKYFIFCLLWSLIVPLSVSAQSGFVKEFAEHEHLKGANWGLIVSIEGKEDALISYNADQNLIPASTMKLLTSAAALHILGDTFKYRTGLYYAGEIDANGVLNGDIIIKGSGDPTLGDFRFKQRESWDELFDYWHTRIVLAGINSVNGNIISDASIFEEMPLGGGWQWNDIGNYYGAGAFGLNLNENQYDLYLKTGYNEGDPVEVKSSKPPTPDLEYKSIATAGPTASGDNIYLLSAPYQELVYVTGTIPRGSTNFMVTGAYPDPPKLIADILYQTLEDRSVSISGDAVTFRESPDLLKEESEWTLIDNYASAPLSSIVYYMNKRSVNIYAECLLRTLGAEVHGFGSVENGVKVLLEFCDSIGLDTGDMILKDGSGLSRTNLLTVQDLNDLLQWIASDATYSTLYASLPIAGVIDDIGSMRAMLDGTKAAGNLRAKSGTLSGVRGYAGYVNNSRGTKLVFAVLVNNFTCSSYYMRKHLEKLMQGLAESDW